MIQLLCTVKIQIKGKEIENEGLRIIIIDFTFEPNWHHQKIALSIVSPYNC